MNADNQTPLEVALNLKTPLPVRLWRSSFMKPYQSDDLVNGNEELYGEYWTNN